MKKILKKIAAGVVAGVVLAVVVTLFMDNVLTELWVNLENKTYDFRYRNKYSGSAGGEILQDGVKSVNLIEDVVIVNIDERSMLGDNMGVYYKWPRRYHGDLVEYLKSGNASTTTFDVHFNDADYGKKETERIAGVFENRKGGGSGLTPAELAKLRSIIADGVNYDRDFVESTRRAGNVIHAMILNDSANYANRSDYIQRTTEAHRLLCNPGSTARMEDSLIDLLRSYPVLDGAFPELAAASDRIGLVNVDADGDGIHRTVPLLNAFRGYVYPTIALQTVLRVMGRTVKEIQFVPGKHLGLGRPFYLEKEKEGGIRVSYPGVNEFMVRALLARKAEIRALKDGTSLAVSVRMKLSKDENGVLSLDIPEGTLSFSSIRDLNGLAAGQLKELNLNEPAALTDATGLIRTGDAEFTLAELQNGEKTVEFIPLSTLLAVSNLDPKAFGGLSNGESRILSENLTVTRRAKGLVTEYVLLRGKALEELLALEPKDLDALKPGRRLECGEPVFIPVDRNARFRINYKGLNQRTFKTISYYDIWAQRVPADYFCGKIFLVGSDAPSMFDIVGSPINEDYPGVEIHATVMSDLLHSDFMRDPPKSAMFLVLLGLCLLVSIASLFLKPFISVPLGLVTSLGYFVLSLTYFDKNLNLEVARPIVGVFASTIFALIYRYITEEKDKKFLKATFANYLSPELIDQMYENKTFPQLGGEESVCTAYFTDIQGFSTFSEELGSPTRLVELLNEYLTGMTDILMEKGGTLDKYIGDAIVAIFGAPMPLKDHAHKAILTAIGMQNKLVELREKWKSEGDKWPVIVHNMRMRIGVNTGNIVTGNMGSKKRMNYTMMGDPVNLAARLESASKQYGVFTMISHFTRDIIGDAFEIRELDKITVLGKTEPVTIFEVIDEKGKVAPEIMKIFEEFNAGLALYKKQEWDKALEIFNHSYKLEKEWRPDQKTNPSKVYVGRCEEFKINPPVPPGSEWDGVYKLKSK